MTGAKNYAEALFSLSEELGRSETVLADLKLFSEALARHPEYIKLTDTPALSVPEKLSLISRSVASLDESVASLIKILCESHSVYLFPKITKEYEALYLDARGIVIAEAISAYPLSDGQLNAIRSRLSRETGKTIRIRNTIDRELLGGVKLRFGGRELDGSLQKRLSNIEKSLMGTIL